ncbi:hypothetical protein ISCGN_003190 [Ixodes scapularis]
MEPNATFRLTGFSREVNGRPLQFQDTAPAPPICALCGLVPAETYTLTCTHLFCPACFAGVVQKTKSSLHCPVDNKSFRPKKALQPSSKAKDYVLGLIVFCFNKTNGCSFFGTVEAMLNHFGGCVYWDLICQLCRAPVLRSNLVSHVKTAHAKPKRNVAPSSAWRSVFGGATVPAIARSPQDHRFAEFEDRKSERAAYYTTYDWTVSPFSKIRVGVHYISSDMFMVGPGYKVQLKGCVDGISTVELQMGLKASRSTVRYFRHNDTEDLERLLLEQQERDEADPRKARVTRRFLVMEGVYANTGYLCPCPGWWSCGHASGCACSSRSPARLVCSARQDRAWRAGALQRATLDSGSAAESICPSTSVDFAVQMGLKASRSTVRYFRYFRHNDTEDLERLLLEQQERDQADPRKASVTRRFLVVEGVYANTGYLCPLPRLVELRARFRLRLFLEESCSLGVLGKTGRGVREHFNVPSKEIDLMCATLENAIGSFGGFCCGTRCVVDHQGYYISASLPPLQAPVFVWAIDHLTNHPEILARLCRNCLLMHEKLKGYVSRSSMDAIFFLHEKRRGTAEPKSQPESPTARHQDRTTARHRTTPGPNTKAGQAEGLQHSQGRPNVATLEDINPNPTGTAREPRSFCPSPSSSP